MTLALLLAACGSDASDISSAVDDASSEVSDQIEGADTEALSDDVSNAGQQLQSQIQEADLSTLYTAMDLVGFDQISTAEAFTFFAPNDSAFSAMSADEMADLLADPDALRQVLEDHYLDTTVMAADLATTPSATSAGGLELVFDTSGDTPTVNGIEIVRSDITLENGVVHIIDGVLMDADA
ncbi:MAG: fasciclin domain-containing protein [Acidimicrobiales bacterium]